MTKINMNITHLKCQQNLPGANELATPQYKILGMSVGMKRFNSFKIPGYFSIFIAGNCICPSDQITVKTNSQEVEVVGYFCLDTIMITI